MADTIAQNDRAASAPRATAVDDGSAAATCPTVPGGPRGRGDGVPSMIGERVGNYRIARRLGEGGMGTVYEAAHVLLAHRAAVKVLLPEWSHEPAFVEQFFHEARVATLVAHPGVIAVYDFGVLPSGHAYILMELLAGESLAARLDRQGRLTEREAFAIVRGLAGVLAAAHANGIVHRDLKPDNIFLVPDPDVPGGERVKLLDFGVATSADLGAERAWASDVVVGTPAYMAPEQCRPGGAIDHRVDVYALGCVLVEMIAGRTPFCGRDPDAVIAAQRALPPPRLRDLVPDCSGAADELAARLLAKCPERRVASMLAVLGLLAELRRRRPARTTKRPGLPGGRSIAALAIAGFSFALAAAAYCLCWLVRRPPSTVVALIGRGARGLTASPAELSGRSRSG